ncbi:MAG: TonB-dependent receptor, partial [Acidobacteriota bacterium]|nr:TonB-dependent receptor [Acidobacteriota bacterium]
MATPFTEDRSAKFLARVAVSVALSLPMAIPSRGDPPVPTDLTQFSLEDLMKVQVTSVSRKEQTLARIGASIFVITQDDIRHSGATNVPDLLRIAPGVDVARLDANRWAISIRGFNSILSDKVLVLIDGRSVYLDSASQVFWDQVDVPLEDIDQIEVIRGPGGTVWGANAVNGVINIITKSAQATKGGLVSGGGGSEVSASGLLQYGGDLRNKGAYRVFGRYFNSDSSRAPSGQRAADGGHGSHGGFRSDWKLSPKDSLTVQGDLFESASGQTVTNAFSNALPRFGTVNDPIAITTANILGRWSHTLANGSDTSLQVYYDFVHRDTGVPSPETIHKLDLDFSHHLALGARNDIVWGLGYRVETTDILPGFAVSILPANSTKSLFSVFLQDEIKLAASVSLTLGSKFEHNGYTGFEYSPSAQFVWAPTSQQTVWASAARAIRQPALADQGVRVDLAIVPLPNGAFAVPTLLGNPQIRAEQLLDYEAGYRSQLTRRLSLDFTAFASFYRRLETIEPQAPEFVLTPGPPHLTFPMVFGNLAHAQNYGAEGFATWEVTGRWKISPAYTLLRMSITRDPSSHDTSIEQTVGNSPEQQFQVRSWLKLRNNLDWDNTVMYVSPLGNMAIPSYVRLDSR